MFLSSEGVGKPLRMASKCLVPDSQVSMRKSMLAGRMNHTSSPQKNMEIGIVKLLSGRCHSAGEFALRTFKRLGTFFLHATERIKCVFHHVHDEWTWSRSPGRTSQRNPRFFPQENHSENDPLLFKPHHYADHLCRPFTQTISTW